MDPTLDELEFLVRSDHRIGVLERLSEGPCDRDGLRTATGASSPTIGRVLADFDERGWIRTNGRAYELTELGEFVADRLEAVRDAMDVERALRDVAEWLPHGIDGFGIELFTDAVVSYPGPGYPYQPVERLTQLVRASDTMCGYGMALLKSSSLEVFFDRALEDLQCEYVYPPAVFKELLSWDAETVGRAANRPNYTVLLHESLPLSESCGVCLFDDRTSICCYDPETGMVQALVDTESDEMRRWATSTFERYRDEARPLDEVDAVVPSGSTS